MVKKYRLLETKAQVLHSETKEMVEVKQIEALIDIPSVGVKVGDTGGFIESEENLSHEGDCWVFSNSFVFANAEVKGNAQIKGFSKVFADSILEHDVIVQESEIQNSILLENVKVENSQIKNTHFSGNVMIKGSDVLLVELSAGNIIDSSLKSFTSAIVGHPDVALEMIASRIFYKGELRLVLQESCKVEHCSFSNVRRFIILKSLTMTRVKSDSPFFLSSRKYTIHFPLVRENSFGSLNGLVLTEETRIRIKESHILLDGSASGNLSFLESNVQTYGTIENHSTGELILKKVDIKDFASIRKKSVGRCTLEDKILAGDDVVEI